MRALPLAVLVLSLSDACATASPPLNLSHNDNLLGPSPAIAAARGGGPAVSADELSAQLAARWSVKPSWVLLGNGSEDVLGRLVKATASPEHGLLTHEHAYIAFRKLADELHVPYHEAPLTPGFGLDVDALLRATDASTALIVLASPVNPSGTYLTSDDAERLAAALEPRGVLLALDCAYLEYVRAKDFADPFELARRHANVVVLGTFSKVYGLTQPKVGYLVARPEVVAKVAAIASAAVPPEGLRLAAVALADTAHVESSRRAAQQSVDELTAQLPTLGFTVTPSEGNFVMAHSPIPASTLTAAVAKQGVLILDLSTYALPDYVRITAGTPEQNAKLLAALRAALAPHP